MFYFPFNLCFFTTAVTQPNCLLLGMYSPHCPISLLFLSPLITATLPSQLPPSLSANRLHLNPSFSFFNLSQSITVSLPQLIFLSLPISLLSLLILTCNHRFDYNPHPYSPPLDHPPASTLSKPPLRSYSTVAPILSSPQFPNQTTAASLIPHRLQSQQQDTESLLPSLGCCE